MPTLQWVGKDKVVNHHHEVPFRVLNTQSSYRAPDSAPANTTANRIIHGDNLEALKSLLPELEGRVNCIYIDPPYNTGNEGWVYNDAVNDPKMKKWLGQVVGKEGEDLSRHDKWLCMMYPRLKLLHRLLADDGSIWISIDDNEVHTLRGMLDEIFGRANFITTVIWQKVYSPKNSARHFSEDHDFALVYAKNANTWTPNPMPRSEKQNDRYKNPDHDLRGVWKAGDLSARNYVAYSEGIPEPERTPLDNPHTPYLLGLNRETAWVFYYEPDRATALDVDFLAAAPPRQTRHRHHLRRPLPAHQAVHGPAWPRVQENPPRHFAFLIQPETTPYGTPPLKSPTTHLGRH